MKRTLTEDHTVNEAILWGVAFSEITDSGQMTIGDFDLKDISLYVDVCVLIMKDPEKIIQDPDLRSLPISKFLTLKGILDAPTNATGSAKPSRSNAKS